MHRIVPLLSRWGLYYVRMQRYSFTITLQVMDCGASLRLDLKIDQITSLEFGEGMISSQPESPFFRLNRPTGFYQIGTIPT